MKFFLLNYLSGLAAAIFVLSLFTDLSAAGGLKKNNYIKGNPPDTALAVTKSEKSRKEQKEIRREALKNSHRRVMFMPSYVFAHLDTKVNFQRPGSIVNVSIGLEENFNLPRKSSFLSGSFIYRFTPSSGLYLNYYGFNRSQEYVTDRDYYWGGDTIPMGTKTTLIFKTHVGSAGYILSILKEPTAFLGAYFNVYIMPLKLGLQSDIKKFNITYEALVPLPNLGIIAMFELTKWLSIYGNVGYFSLYIDALGGNISDFTIALLFKAAKWLKFHLSYQNFYVHAIFPEEPIDTSVDYNYKGPAIGVTLTF